MIREAVERGREEDGGADEQAHADSETGEDRGRRACGGMGYGAGPCASRAERLPGLGTGVGRARERELGLRWSEGRRSLAGPPEEKKLGWPGLGFGLGFFSFLFFSISFSFPISN